MSVASSYFYRLSHDWPVWCVGLGFGTGTLGISMFAWQYLAWNRTECGLVIGAIISLSLPVGILCLLVEQQNRRAFNWKAALKMFATYAVVSIALSATTLTFAVLGIVQHLKEARVRRKIRNSPMRVMHLTTYTYEDAKTMTLSTKVIQVEAEETPLGKVA